MNSEPHEAGGLRQGEAGGPASSPDPGRELDIELPAQLAILPMRDEHCFPGSPVR
jgi:hypothetical protein